MPHSRTARRARLPQAATGGVWARNPGYHVRNVASHSPFNTRVRICSSKMGAPLAPLHLLFLHHALAHHLVHRRFHKARADPLAVAVALAVVRDEAGIVLDVRVELLHRFAQFPCCAIVARRRPRPRGRPRRTASPARLEHIAMPQKPFEPFELPHHIVTECATSSRSSVVSASLWRSAAWSVRRIVTWNQSSRCSACGLR